jgi:hypothetical protein
MLLAIFLFGSSVLAVVKAPHEDEGAFASAAVALAAEGQLKMPMWANWIPSLERTMFITMPLYFVQLAGWASLFGSSLYLLRFDSVLWGLVLVWSWYGMLRRLSVGHPAVPILGLVFIAGNYDVMNLTSARYDPMVAGLNAAGMFAYVYWRQDSVRRAVLASNICLALAAVTHPYALFGIVGVAILFLTLDRAHCSLRLLLWAALPYAVTLGAWGLYIAHHPQDFLEQMAVNSTDRLRYLAAPWEAIRTDVIERYWRSFAGFRPDTPVYMRVKLFVLIAYLAGFAGCLATPAIRRRPEWLALVLYGAACFLMLMFLEGMRWYVYFIHALPAYGAVLAIWLGVLWSRRHWRPAIAAVAAVFVLYSLTTVAYRWRLNEYWTVYQPTLEYLQARVRPGDLVIASSEFGPGLGFREHVLGDRSMELRNGRVPRFVVLDERDRHERETWKRTDPSKYAHIERAMRRYRLVYESKPAANRYAIYELIGNPES